MRFHHGSLAHSWDFLRFPYVKLPFPGLAALCTARSGFPHVSSALRMFALFRWNFASLQFMRS